MVLRKSVNVVFDEEYSVVRTCCDHLTGPCCGSLGVVSGFGVLHFPVPNSFPGSSCLGLPVGGLSERSKWVRVETPLRPG